MNKFNVIFYFYDGTRLSFFIKSDKMDGVVSKAYDSHKSMFGGREVDEISIKCKKGVEWYGELLYQDLEFWRFNGKRLSRILEVQEEALNLG